MATRNWTLVYEQEPPGAESLGLADDRQRDRMVDVRERAAREHSWGPGEVSGREGDHMQPCVPTLQVSPQHGTDVLVAARGLDLFDRQPLVSERMVEGGLALQILVERHGRGHAVEDHRILEAVDDRPARPGEQGEGCCCKQEGRGRGHGVSHR